MWVQVPLAGSTCDVSGNLSATPTTCRNSPLAVTIMDEELVAFRDFRGQVGLLEGHCSHRGTSLEFGLVSEKGIRCCYHG